MHTNGYQYNTFTTKSKDASKWIGLSKDQTRLLDSYKSFSLCMQAKPLQQIFVVVTSWDIHFDSGVSLIVNIEVSINSQEDLAVKKQKMPDFHTCITKHASDISTGDEINGV